MTERIFFLSVLLWFVGCAESDRSQATRSRSVKENGVTTQSDAAALSPSDSTRQLNDDSTGRINAPVVPGTVVDVPSNEPTAGGWETEVISIQIQAQLSRIGEILSAQADGHDDDISKLVHDKFDSSALRPPRLETVFSSDSIKVAREATNAVSETGRKFFGHAGFRKVISDLAGTLPLQGDRHAEFKVFRVDRVGQSVSSAAYFEIARTGSSTLAAITSIWVCRWRIDESDGQPRLISIEVSDFELTSAMTDQGKLFAECTDAVFLQDPAFENQLRPGVDAWLESVEQRFGIDIGGWQGITVADVNNDDLDDIYVCQPGGLPNRLYLQNHDGTLRDVSTTAGVDILDGTHGALFIDSDNDGDQDLFVAVMTGLLMFSNEGDGTYRHRGSQTTPAAIPYAISAADFDQDGDLDLYVCCYNRRDDLAHIVFARPVPYHDANNGGRNVLLRNEGDWRFVHATKQIGLDQNNRRFSYASAWNDFDSDGDLDLYVANDFGRNNLYQNNNGAFVDVASRAGVEDVSPGMSVSWGDYNRDGLADLYVSNMFSSAGNRITFQDRFQARQSPEIRQQFQRHARGNSLFKNRGDGTFEDVSTSAKVTLGRWAWGSRFVDLNNDGWQDLVVTNGFITQDDPDDL